MCAGGMRVSAGARNHAASVLIFPVRVAFTPTLNPGQPNAALRRGAVARRQRVLRVPIVILLRKLHLPNARDDLSAYMEVDG